MEFNYFSKNGEPRPIEEAVIPLSDIAYQYGFGVYESIRVVNGVVYFADEHIERLMESARIIGLAHSFTKESVLRALEELVQKIGGGTYNLKILLIGGVEPNLFILPLNPHFPDKKLYRDGVHCTTYTYERAFPHAKTLNMLQSYLAYKKAKEAGAYDSLLIDREGYISEGTRTNFFCIKGKTLFSPPGEKILLGVTRKIVLKVAEENGFAVVEKEIRPETVPEYHGAFLSSTSSNIIPVRSINDRVLESPPEPLRQLMSAFDRFWADCKGQLD